MEDDEYDEEAEDDEEEEEDAEDEEEHEEEEEDDDAEDGGGGGTKTRVREEKDIAEIIPFDTSCADLAAAVRSKNHELVKQLLASSTAFNFDECPEIACEVGDHAHVDQFLGRGGAGVNRGFVGACRGGQLEFCA